MDVSKTQTRYKYDIYIWEVLVKFLVAFNSHETQQGWHIMFLLWSLKILILIMVSTSGLLLNDYKLFWTLIWFFFSYLTENNKNKTPTTPKYWLNFYVFSFRFLVFFFRVLVEMCVSYYTNRNPYSMNIIFSLKQSSSQILYEYIFFCMLSFISFTQYWIKVLFLCL